MVILEQCLLEVRALECGDVDANGAVTITASVTSIPSYAFVSCTALTSMSFEEGSQLTSIGYLAFSGSGLKSITLPASLTSIDQQAFYICLALKSVRLRQVLS
jgi:hypothetical protein